jgi:hypothetical protein
VWQERLDAGCSAAGIVRRHLLQALFGREPIEEPCRAPWVGIFEKTIWDGALELGVMASAPAF